MQARVGVPGGEEERRDEGWRKGGRAIYGIQNVPFLVFSFGGCQYMMCFRRRDLIRTNVKRDSFFFSSRDDIPGRGVQVYFSIPCTAYRVPGTACRTVHCDT